MRGLIAVVVLLLGSVAGAAEININGTWRKMDPFVPGTHIYIDSPGSHYLYREARKELWYYQRGIGATRLPGDGVRFTKGKAVIRVR